MRTEPIALDAGRLALVEFELLSSAPGEFGHPSELPTEGWLAARAPGTVASALRALGRWDFESSRDFDAEDHWYRCDFAAPSGPFGARLVFDGLATLADVYVNGTKLLSAENMFLPYAVELASVLMPHNTLHIHFRALSSALKQRRPRPRYRTKLVEQQQLRYLRTSLLGRTPGFCPRIAPVGPFRSVWLEAGQGARVTHSRVTAELKEQLGLAKVELALELDPGLTLTSATIQAFGGEHPCSMHAEGGRVTLRGEARLSEPPRWWPHTHGPQPLFEIDVRLGLSDGRTLVQRAGRVGFRTLTLDTENGGFAFRINGEDVFCRGVCWTPLDVVALDSSEPELRAALGLLRDAGMNMIRVGGTMTYESGAFHRLCDELGILVWQEFMFANMDYPAADEAFMASVRAEAEALVGRLAAHPSTALFCGNSEVEQQAAMLGLPRDAWLNPVFYELLPGVVRELGGGLPYWPSSPSGGELPFHVARGAAHYYGVGAYQRPLEDARRSEVRFASECLAFANVPDESTLDRMHPDGAPPIHHPRWKERVPRDRGASWDFDDVREYYTELLFGVRPKAVVYGDPERYLALARVTSGEVMARTFAEWRRAGSCCRGGLIFFHRDFWPGAGWGIIDATGRPKAAYFYLKRVLKPLALLITDEGMDGIALHLVNERTEPVEASLRVALYRGGEVRVTEATQALTLAGRSVRRLEAQTLFDAFVDFNYAYRFGPPAHDLVVATLTSTRDDAAQTAFFFPLGLHRERELDVGLSAEARPHPEGFWLDVRTRRFAQSVSLHLRDAEPADNYFHLEPGGCKSVLVRTASPKLSGEVRALNAHLPARVQAAKGEP